MALTPLIDPNDPRLQTQQPSVSAIPTLRSLTASPDSAPSVSAMPSSMPNLPTLKPLVTSPRQQQEDALQQKISSYENPTQQGGFWHKLGHIANTIRNVAETAIAPNVAAADPTSMFHQQLEHGQNVRELAGLQKEDQDEQDAASERTLRGAQTEETNARTQALENPPDKPVNWEHLETDQGIFARNPQTNELVPLTFNGKPLLPKPPAQKELSAENDLKNQILAAEQSGDQNKVKQLQQQLKDLNPAAEQRFAFTVQSSNEREEDKKSKGVKPTADEQRRADLSENLTENLDRLEDIARRRPELFGPIAGRFTELKDKFGTSDPDIAELETIKHQIGMAQISAHGMRSAQGIDAAAQSLLNGFHNTAEAMHGAIQAARNSVQTFQHDADNPGTSRSTREAPPAQGGTQHFTVNGKTYNIPSDQVADFKKEFPNAK